MVCPEAYASMEPNGELPAPFVDCELPSPCAEVVYEMIGQGGTDGGDENQNAEALSCVLDALASGEPGQFSFVAENSTTTIHVEIRVYAQGRAEWSYDEVEDSAWTQSRTPAQIDPAYFSNNVCNATTTWSGGWNCIRDGLAACATWADDATLCPG